MYKYVSLSYAQRYFSKRKLVKTFLHTQLKQTNLENGLHISAESPKGFNDIVFQYFEDDLIKHCNSGMRMDLRLLVPLLFVSVFNIFGCYVTF